MSEFFAATTALTLSAVGAANVVLGQSSQAFAAGHGQRPRAAEARVQGAADTGALGRPAVALQESLGTKGLVGFGMGFGAVVAAVRGVARSGRRRVGRRAADIDVAEKTETKPLPYFESLPRTIIEKKKLDALLSALPREQWEDPPEGSYLYTLKMYAETYGPGKATKMGWWDYLYLKYEEPDFFETAETLKEAEDEFRAMSQGSFPMWIPGPSNIIDTGAYLQWRGEEPFAGDQVKTIVSDSRFSKQFIGNLAFYREGLKPWQRGLEIGMAHGYFIIGPFVSLGPLRNTPEAATVGLLCGCALIGIVSVGGLLFGTIQKPTLFDKKGDAPAAGFQEMINWHALGGIGGAGFAHALITVFGG